MRIWFGAILMVSLVFVSTSFAQAPSDKGSDFGTHMQSYFRHPDAKAIVDEFFSLPPSEVAETDQFYITGAFFSQLINEDPAVADLLVEKAEGAGEPFKKIVVASLNLSHQPQRLELIHKIGGDDFLKWMGPSNGDLRDLTITHPIHLDMMWASFFATGDDVYIDRVAEMTEAFVTDDKFRELVAAANKDPHAYDPMLKAAIAKAAVWSLTSNATNYPEVRAALVNFVQHHQGMAAAMSAAVLAKTNPK